MRKSRFHGTSDCQHLERRRGGRPARRFRIQVGRPVVHQTTSMPVDACGQAVCGARSAAAVNPLRGSSARASALRVTAAADRAEALAGQPKGWPAFNTKMCRTSHCRLNRTRVSVQSSGSPGSLTRGAVLAMIKRRVPGDDRPRPATHTTTAYRETGTTTNTIADCAFSERLRLQRRTSTACGALRVGPWRYALVPDGPNEAHQRRSPASNRQV